MRDFLSDFLLPLVRGGTVHVGRPLGPRAVERSLALVTEEQARELARLRRAAAAEILSDAAAPLLDQTTIRLGAAVHNLLALSHPGLEGPRSERRQARIGEAAAGLADVGPPRTEREAVDRHTLLARLPDMTRSDHTVHFWVGRRSYVGRPPPARIVALPRLRGVRVETVRRTWLREIGVPGPGRKALLLLHLASPLGEALDPMRLDPPPAWGRILCVLRFPGLCRLAAGRVVEIGIEAAGGALAAALFRFASLQEPIAGQAPTPGAVAFAIRFLAHSVWLAEMWKRAGDAPGPVDVSGGLDLATLLAAAEAVDPSLVWPADASRASPVGSAFATRLAALRSRASAHSPERYRAAIGFCRIAAGHEQPDAGAEPA